MKVSIKKISEVTGFSVATVSRVLNNKGKYSKETEIKVKKAIKEYNYVPNMIAKGLRTNQIPTIGIIVPDITNEYFSKITLAAQTTLFNRNYSAFICNTNERRELEERHLKLMRSQNISGIIFVCCEQFYQGDLYDEIPKIYVDRTPVIEGKEEELILIQSDNYEGGRLAIRELVQSGCKRIVSIFDSRDVSPKVNRLRGVKDELKAHGLDDSGIYYASEMTYEGTRVVIEELLQDGLTFDGVFSYNDIGALGVIKALNEHGITVPRGVKVIGFDGISHAEYNTPSISTISQPMEKMGELAAETILKLLENEEIIEKRRILPVTLIKRDTTI